MADSTDATPASPAGERPYTTPDRIPYCWVPLDGGRARCTRDPGHDGDHEDYYARAWWPNLGPEPQ